jgi:hypothetical protein
VEARVANGCSARIERWIGPGNPNFYRLFPLKRACPVAIAALDFNVETSAAILAGRVEGTSARALRAWSRKCHLGLVPLATGTYHTAYEHACCSTASAWTSFLCIGSGSRTFSTTYSHCPATATTGAITCQTARAIAPQAFDDRAGEGIALRRMLLSFGVG